MSDNTPHAKVSYSPIESAIRWSGLVQHESTIKTALQTRPLPDVDHFPQWPELRLNAERIYDAIVYHELPCRVNGTPFADDPDLYHAHVTIRHVDLKRWMERFYPGDRPEFLFSSLERSIHPAITIETFQVLLAERTALKSQIELRNRELENLRRGQSSPEGTEKQRTAKPATPTSESAESYLSPRSETTYLHIVGGLLSVLLGRSPAGQPYSNFRTQEAIVSAMIAHHGERLGITERTLHAKFAAAKRRLTGE